MNNRAGTIAEAMNDYDLRRMANETYFETLADVRWYMRRGGNNSGTVAKVLSMWIRMMAPITPHIAEELWEGLGEKGFVSIAPYPEPDNELIDSYAEVAETYLVNVMSDINEILRVTGISPKRVILYTAPEWKRDVLSIGLELASGGQLTIPALTKAVMSRDDLKRRGKEAAEFARKIAEDLMRRADGERKRLSIEVDELSYLTESAAFLSKEVGATVEVYSADDASAPDPQKKARAAQPRRPAIYVE
jgi:leucyl-tRNA synthetase